MPYDSFELYKPFKIGDRFTTRVIGSQRIEYPESGNQSVWLWRWVSEYMFEWQGRLKFTLEKTSEERHNVTVLFAWEDVADYDFYILFTDIRDGDDEEQALFAKYVKRF